LISTFNSVYAMPMPMVSQYANEYRTALQNEPGAADLNGSIAMCYLKLGQHDKALSAFEKAIEDKFDNSETFFPSGNVSGFSDESRLCGRRNPFSGVWGLPCVRLTSKICFALIL